MKHLYPVLIASILFGSPALASYPDPVTGKENHTFPIAHKFSTEDGQSDYRCMQPQSGPVGDPYFNNQYLEFVKCLDRKQLGEEVGLFYFNDGKLKASINSRTDSTEIVNYCVTLDEEYLSAYMAKCDDKNPGQQFQWLQDERGSVFYSPIGMCLGEKNGMAYADPCGDEPEPKILFDVWYTYEPIRIDARNHSSVSDIEVTVSTRAIKESDWSYAEKRVLDPHNKESTAWFTEPGFGYVAQADYYSPSTGDKASAATDQSYEGSLLYSWLVGSAKHLSAYIKVAEK